MKIFRWQVITHWVCDDGNAFVHTVAFASQQEAWREEERLSPLLGASTDAKTLKSIQVVADPGACPSGPASRKAT